MDVPPVSFSQRDRASSYSDAASGDAAARTSTVTNALRTILFREVLEPLTAALGPVGDALSDRVVDGLLGRRKA